MEIGFTNSIRFANYRGEITMKFVYLAQPPNKWTFKQPKLKKWTED